MSLILSKFLTPFCPVILILRDTLNRWAVHLLYLLLCPAFYFLIVPHGWTFIHFNDFHSKVFRELTVFMLFLSKWDFGFIISVCKIWGIFLADWGFRLSFLFRLSVLCSFWDFWFSVLIFQDNYFEEALKMRNLLEEFHADHGIRPPTILGVREHVFTGRFVCTKELSMFLATDFCYLYLCNYA